MLLYIIRHGDPNYEKDTVTELGQMQSEALARRLAVNGIDKIYSSPLGRARDTAKPTCELLGLECNVEDWLNENNAHRDISVQRPNGDKSWPFFIQNTELKNNETGYSSEDWFNHGVFKGFNSKSRFERIERDADDFIRRLGYERDGFVYKILRPSNERVAVFCHQGIGTSWIAHLLQIPPNIFWATFDLSHTGVSIFQFDNNKDGLTNPRCLCLSDLSHIYKEGLPYKYNNSIDL